LKGKLNFAYIVLIFLETYHNPNLWISLLSCYECICQLRAGKLKIFVDYSQPFLFYQNYLFQIKNFLLRDARNSPNIIAWFHKEVLASIVTELICAKAATRTISNFNIKNASTTFNTTHLISQTDYQQMIVNQDRDEDESQEQLQNNFNSNASERSRINNDRNRWESLSSNESEETKELHEKMNMI